MRRFSAGFLIGLLSFAAANVASYYLLSDPLDAADGIHRAGFPLLVWAE